MLSFMMELWKCSLFYRIPTQNEHQYFRPITFVIEFFPSH